MQKRIESECTRLFTTCSLEEIRRIEEDTRSKIAETKNELQSLIADNYQQLIASADSNISARDAAANAAAEMEEAVEKFDFGTSPDKTCEMVPVSGDVEQESIASILKVAKEMKAVAMAPVQIAAALNTNDCLLSTCLYCRSQLSFGTLTAWSDEITMQLMNLVPLLAHQQTSLKSVPSLILSLARKQLESPQEDSVGALYAYAMLDCQSPSTLLQLLLDSHLLAALSHLVLPASSAMCGLLRSCTATLHQVVRIFVSDSEVPLLAWLLGQPVALLCQRRETEWKRIMQGHTAVDFGRGDQEFFGEDMNELCVEERWEVKTSVLPSHEVREICKQWVQKVSCQTAELLPTLLRQSVFSPAELASIVRAVFSTLDECSQPCIPLLGAAPFLWDEVFSYPVLCHARLIITRCFALLPLYFHKRLRASCCRLLLRRKHQSSLTEHKKDINPAVMRLCCFFDKQLEACEQEVDFLCDGTLPPCRLGDDENKWSQILVSHVHKTRFASILRVVQHLEELSGGGIHPASIANEVADSERKREDEEKTGLQDPGINEPGDTGNIAMLTDAESFFGEDSDENSNRYTLGEVNLDEDSELSEEECEETKDTSDEEGPVDAAASVCVALFVGSVARALCDLSQFVGKLISANRAKESDLGGSGFVQERQTPSQDLESRLARLELQGHLRWIGAVAGGLQTRLLESLRREDWTRSDRKDCWEMLPVSSGKNGDVENIALPSHPSPALQEFFFLACRELTCMSDYPLPIFLQQHLVGRLGQVVLYTLKQLLCCPSSPISLCLEACLQLWFDLMYALEVLKTREVIVKDLRGELLLRLLRESGCPHQSAAVWSEEVAQVLELVRCELDPIDIAFYEKHLRNSVQGCCTRCSILLAPLMHLQDLHGETKLKPAVQEHHNILVLAPPSGRLVMLPITAPVPAVSLPTPDSPPALPNTPQPLSPTPKRSHSSSIIDAVGRHLNLPFLSF